MTDDDLLEAVRRMLDRYEGAPSSAAIDAGADALSWRTVDAELAELLGSEAFQDAVAAVRDGDDLSSRTFAFSGRDLTVEIDIVAGSDAVLTGQLAPLGPARIELQQPGQRPRSGVADDNGRFRFPGRVEGLLRLLVQPDQGPALITPWVTV